MSVQDEFNTLVGLIVKDPYRSTSDTDPEGQKITDLARKHGLMVSWTKAGEKNEPFMCDVEAVHIHLTKEGVPTDKKSWGWRVQQIHSDR